MTFFLTQIVARAVAAWFAVDCWRVLRRAIAERRIRERKRDLLETVLFDPSDVVVGRDDAPVRYWLTFGLEAAALLACIVVALHGWWLPHA